MQVQQNVKRRKAAAYNILADSWGTHILAMNKDLAINDYNAKTTFGDLGI